MDGNNTQIEAIAAKLAQEIAYTHDAIMAVHKFVEQGGDPKVQIDCMKIAARMMQAQAAAALSLQRLTSPSTVTIIHEKRAGKRPAGADIPAPEKSKTNRYDPGEWEDGITPDG